MHNLLTLNYWFNLRPEILTPLAQKLFLGFIGLLIVLAVVTGLLKTRGGLYRGWLKRLYTFFVAQIVIGLVFLFFDYELVPFFSARFWLALWGLAMLVWLVFILLSLKKIPEKKKSLVNEAIKNKYLP